MILLLLLAASLAHSCSGGVYPGTYSTSEAHGPLARFALDSMAAGGGLRYLGAPGATVPVTHGVAPVPVTVPFATVPVPARYAAPVGLVHHVPTVADVPVTKYFAQPGFVQKVVDVTKTKYATAKLQVRRPAIQKQFYDIEERTVVRPVGSAVVELEEPISKNLVSPFTAIPSGQHTVARYQRPFAYPVNAYPFVSSYPFQAPGQTYPPFFIQQTQGITQLPQRPQIPQQSPIPQLPQLPQRPQPPQQPQFPQQPQIPQQPQFPQQPQIPQQPQFPQQPQIPQQPQFPQQPQIPQQPQFPQQPQVPQQPPQLVPSFPQPIGPPEGSESNEFDFSDTVVVENPELGRSRNSNDEEQKDKTTQNEENTTQERSKNENTEQPENQFETASDQDILNEFQTRQLLRQYFSQNNFILPDQGVQRISQNPQQTQAEELPNLQKADSNEANTKSRSEESSESATQESSSTELPNTSFRSLNPQGLQRQPTRLFSSEGQIASTRALSPEEAQSNQQKLIELLTGRGEISELQLSRSGVKISSVGDAGVVRGRVLSVTPAPRTAEGEERVSTRRVVVSRPVQTLEEVDVQQPFAHVERVAVHEPALLKTAHTHVARVPVLTPTLAPVIYR